MRREVELYVLVAHLLPAIYSLKMIEEKCYSSRLVGQYCISTTDSGRVLSELVDEGDDFGEHLVYFQ